jgi:hypothetical protein
LVAGRGAVCVTISRQLCRYGDVYLARWHGSDVAVKCMNPSLFFGTGELACAGTSGAGS